MSDENREIPLGDIDPESATAKALNDMLRKAQLQIEVETWRRGEVPDEQG